MRRRTCPNRQQTANRFSRRSLIKRALQEQRNKRTCKIELTEFNDHRIDRIDRYAMVEYTMVYNNGIGQMVEYTSTVINGSDDHL